MFPYRVGTIADVRTMLRIVELIFRNYDGKLID